MVEMPASKFSADQALSLVSKQKSFLLTNLYIDEIAAARAKLSEHVHVLCAIFDSIGDAVIVWDKNEKTILANRAMFELAGRNLVDFPRRELLSAYQFFQNDGITPLSPEELPYEFAFREQRAVSTEGLVLGANLPPEGKLVRVIASPILDDDNQFLGVVTVAQDITEKKRFELQRNVMATLITHDLKNHLACWDMLFALLQSQLGDKIDARYEKLMNELRDDNSQFLDLSNTLLELYRSELFALPTQQVKTDIEEVLQAAIAMNSQRAAYKQVKLTAHSEENLPAITCIPAVLRQGLHNLIQNAVEVVNIGGNVRLALNKSSELFISKFMTTGPV